MSGADLIRAKHFSYVQIFLHDADCRVYGYVILEPSVPKARARALAFVAHRWPRCRNAEVSIYPRTYVQKALERYSQGYVIP